MKKSLLFLLLILSTCTFAGPYHPDINYIFPEPDNKFITTRTTVILTLDEPLNSQISNLSKLISVKQSGNTISGETFIAADDRTIIFKPNNRLPKDSKIDVTIQTSQFGGDDFSYSFYTPSDSPNEMDWLPKQSISSGDEIVALAPPRLINGVAVPSDFPEIYANKIGETAPGRIFIPAGKWIIICENDGTPYFFRKYEDGHEKMRFEAQESGVLSFHSFEVYDVILDQNFVEIDTIRPGHGYAPDDHELQILENGHKLLVGRESVRVNMSNVVSGGNSNASVEAHHVQELDQDDNVVFEWNNWNHLDIREAKVGLRGGSIDFVHLNSIAVDYDGNLIVSPREYNRIMKINRTTGETIWQLGGENSDFTFVNENLEFSRIHDVRPVPGKPNHYTLFDNGRDRSSGGQFSRGVEYKLDLDAKTAEKVWQYRHSPDLYTSYCGGLQPLENGNRFISWANNDYFCEVNSSGELVYEMHVSGFSCSRARRDVWDGMMLQPYLIMENMGSVIRLIFNKFGDPNVNYYNVYFGTTSNSLTLLDSTKQTYMDIDAASLGNGARYFFRVSAVNHDGMESDLSDMESVTVRIIAPGENAVQQGEFQKADAWVLNVSGSADASGHVNADGFYEININNGGGELRRISLQQNSIFLMQGKDYTFEFDAYATQARAIGAKILSTDSDRINYGNIDNTALSTRLRHYSFDFPMNHPSDTDAQVVFECGGSDADVFIDNVSLTYKNISDELSPLQDPWRNRDVGTPSLAGLAGMLGNTLLVRGSGADIWGVSDAFHFVYQRVQGDADIIARVYSIAESHEWSKAGVMMRNSLDASSRHAMMIVSGNSGAAFQYRVNDGGQSDGQTSANIKAPHWVRLVRKGDSFSGYESSNGTTWTRVADVSIDMNAIIYVGLPVTSHNDGVICEALFDNVKLNNTMLSAEKPIEAPSTFKLHQAFPNPFNPETTIQYDLPSAAHVEIVVYDIQGRRVRTLVDEKMDAGSHKVVWEGTNGVGEKVASGLYFYRLHAGDMNAVQKVTMLK